MGVAQKTMFSISDRLAKFFGVSGAPMEHNATAKSKKTFLLEIRPFSHKRPRTIINYLKLNELFNCQKEMFLYFSSIPGTAAVLPDNKHYSRHSSSISPSLQLQKYTQR